VKTIAHDVEVTVVGGRGGMASLAHAGWSGGACRLAELAACGCARVVSCAPVGRGGERTCGCGLGLRAESMRALWRCVSL
jgi:hypothetical protein